MSTFKKCKVFMLPTNQKAMLHQFKYGAKNLTLYNNPNPTINGDGNGTSPQHLYILSDDKPLNGDWVYGTYSNFETIDQLKTIGKYGPNSYLLTNGLDVDYRYIKKIIATTDTLFPCPKGIMCEYLPSPSQSFIEKYVSEYNKGNVITEVMVEYEEKDINPLSPTWEEDYVKYGIMHEKNMQPFLKINSKDNTITVKRVKDSWTRDEVEKLILKYGEAFGTEIYCRLKEDGTFQIDLHGTKRWIENNL